MFALTGLLALLLASPDLHAETIGINHEPNVLWYRDDSGGRGLLFIPASILQRAEDLKGLPISDEQRSELLKRVQEAKKRREQPEIFEGGPKCQTPIEGDVEYPVGEEKYPPGRRLEAIGRRPVSFLGRIISVLPGWVPPYAHVESLVRVQVQEVFSGGPRLEPGQEVTYLQDAGSFALLGEELCTEASPEIYAAQPGDRVVVAGDWDSTNGGHIETNAFFVFPVMNNKVWPLPDRQYREAPIPLDRIRERQQTPQ